MKKHLKTLLFLSLTAFVGCEKVIELDLDTQKAELVVDASLDWEKGTLGNTQTIHLSYTQPYYSQQTPPVASGATLSVTDDSAQTFLFVETSQRGTYRCNDFSPSLGKRYTLAMNYQGKQYTATDTMQEVPQLTNDNITQTNDGGFTRNEIMLTLRFDANPREQNNFVLRIKASSDGVTRLYGFDGRYFKDGHFFTQIVSRGDEDEKFKPGDTVEITLYRVSENYMNYIRVLGNNSSENAGLFTIPNRVRGNVVDVQNPNDNPLGAFRVAQYSKIVYTIQ